MQPPISDVQILQQLLPNQNDGICLIVDYNTDHATTFYTCLTHNSQARGISSSNMMVTASLVQNPELLSFPLTSQTKLWMKLTAKPILFYRFLQ